MNHEHASHSNGKQEVSSQLSVSEVVRHKWSVDSKEHFAFQLEIATTLAPTDNEHVFGARTHDWLVTSHINRSYLESVILTIFDSRDYKFTSVKLRKTDGGSPARMRKCRYNYGIFDACVNTRGHTSNISRTSVPMMFPAVRKAKHTS